MEAAARRDAYIMIAPIALFLLVMLAIPFLVDLVYSVSRVTFETIRAPSFFGLGNFVTVMRDQSLWNAMLCALRFAVLVTIAEVSIGLFLAIFLAPLLSARPWLIAILMLPMMVAPALVGLMYRLILHEFVGVIPYYFYLFTNDSPSFLGPQNAFYTLVVIETLQWTPFALLILYSAYQARASRPPSTPPGARRGAPSRPGGPLGGGGGGGGGPFFFRRPPGGGPDNPP